VDGNSRSDMIITVYVCVSSLPPPPPSSLSTSRVLSNPLDYMLALEMAVKGK